MSLFVDSLAFKDDALYEYADRLAILLASFMSGIVGYLLLRCSKGCKVETRYE
jgi:NhaA family Na+:H+ antiporter